MRLNRPLSAAFLPRESGRVLHRTRALRRRAETEDSIAPGKVQPWLVQSVECIQTQPQIYRFRDWYVLAIKACNQELFELRLRPALLSAANKIAYIFAGAAVTTTLDLLIDKSLHGFLMGDVH